jgi:hypothetical protein
MIDWLIIPQGFTINGLIFVESLLEATEIMDIDGGF